MKFPSLTPDLCGTLAREVFGLPNSNSNKTNKALDKEIFESLIGTSYNVCSELWNLINPSMKTELQGAHPKQYSYVYLGICYLFNYHQTSKQEMYLHPLKPAMGISIMKRPRKFP
jgi:hypothetical protein